MNESSPQATCSETNTSKPNRANRKQTEEITYVTVLAALVQYTSVHEVEYYNAG